MLIIDQEINFEVMTYYSIEASFMANGNKTQKIMHNPEKDFSNKLNWFTFNFILC